MASSIAYPSLPKMFIGIAVENWLRYALFAGFAWLLGYVLFKKHWWSRKVNQSLPAREDVLRELRYSLLTSLIYGLVAVVTIAMSKWGWTRMYRNIGEHGWQWFWLSIAITIIIHDTYFYWTHRLMHHRKLFRLFHRVHHESTNPSPWAAYSFAPLEALMQALIFPLTVFILPIHPMAFMLFMVRQIFFNVLGHTGYEYHPRWLMSSWLGKFFNTPTHHIQHHERVRGNYGLYFNLWDRLMNTNHPEYENRFLEVTTRVSAKSD